MLDKPDSVLEILALSEREKRPLVVIPGKDGEPPLVGLLSIELEERDFYYVPVPFTGMGFFVNGH